jgi:hypothetical protein
MWLEQIFSGEGNGGVVCVIDNLELLETGASARRTLEAMRDRLFNVPGLRWVFCGANGGVKSLAASPRLEAFLNTPVIQVEHIHPSALRPLFEARFREFAMGDVEEVYDALPFTLDDLQHLYLLVNFNLRSLIHLADTYCEAQVVKVKRKLTREQKAKQFDRWLFAHTVGEYQALQSRLPTDAWAILDSIMSDDLRGTFGVGDYKSLNQNSKTEISLSTFEKRLRDLERNGLISKSIEDDSGSSSDGDFKRDVFNVTAKGALVHYARTERNEAQGIKPVTWLRRVHPPG